MPTQNKNDKGKQQKAGAAAAQTDDDFDDMLAELCAADLAFSLQAPPPQYQRPQLSRPVSRVM
jgi:hypothetical protein